MADDGQSFSSHNDSAAAAVSSELMIAAVIFLFMVVVFIFFLYLYAKHYMGPHPALRRRRGSFLFPASDVILPFPRRGLLDAEILDSIPVKPFKASDFPEGLECSVCLSEVSEGEDVRLLPKCGHGFHVACIDMWFDSHSTCPLCRAAVEPAVDPTAEEATGFPTNVLFWGSDRGVSASREENSRPRGPLAIDIPPRSAAEGFLPTPTAGRSVEEDAKTPKSGRLRSFRRLLSRGKMVVGSSCSPRGGGDIEQGVAGEAGSSLAPKTPTC